MDDVGRWTVDLVTDFRLGSRLHRQVRSSVCQQLCLLGQFFGLAIVRMVARTSVLLPALRLFLRPPWRAYAKRVFRMKILEPVRSVLELRRIVLLQILLIP